MRLNAVITCPIWDQGNGQRTIGHPPADDPDPNVIGWANLLDIELQGERHLLLLTKDAHG